MILPFWTTTPRITFTRRLLLILIAILLGFATSTGLVFTWIQRQTGKQHLEEKGELVAAMFSNSLQAGLYFEDYSRIEEAVKALFHLTLHEKLMGAAVYNKNQEIILSRSESDGENPAPDSGLTETMSDALQAYLMNPATARPWESYFYLVFTIPITVIAPQGDHESLYFDTPPKMTQPTVIGYAQIVISKRQFYIKMGETVLQTVLLTVMFLLIAVWVTYRFTISTMAPLKRLVEIIRTRENLPIKAPDDVGLLGDAFSRLLRDLENAFITIQDLKNGLETTVDKRTQELRIALDELRETHIQLTQSEKMVAIGRLVAGVAHEINNTTNFVSGAMPPLRKRIAELETIAEGMRSLQPDPERCDQIFASINQLMENISEGARRTNKIVNDLKTFSRPADEEPGPVDINQCLRTTCALAWPEYKHFIELTLELDEDLPLVEGVSGQLNQVFMNLILNAAQAQPEKGTILVRTWSADDEVHVLVKDNGPGIPAAIINQIFEPFFTTKEVGKGTGLGLSISYGIIKKHQGTILVRSQPGQGTEFEVILPLVRQQEPTMKVENGQ